jgi:hypothetical protein
LRSSEATILAQLRTGRTFLKEYLHKINASETADCDCGLTESNTTLSLLLQEMGAAESQVQVTAWRAVWRPVVCARRLLEQTGRRREHRRAD